MDEIERRIAKLGGKGILFESDLESLNMARLQILELMLDQKWHSRLEIINAAGGTDNNVGTISEGVFLRTDGDTSAEGENLNIGDGARQPANLFGHLIGKLTCRAEHQ